MTLKYRKYDLPDGGVYLAGIDKKGNICTHSLYYRANPKTEKHSEGFGGSILTFDLEDGSDIKLQGPWNSNSDHFFQSTGVDVRRNIPTVVWLTQKRDVLSSRDVEESDVLYREDEPVFGSFYRELRVAEKYFEDHPEVEKLCITRWSSGGGSGSCTNRERLKEEIKYWKSIGEIV